MTQDATVRLPAAEPTGATKQVIYEYRGEIVSVGSMMDWIINRLSIAFEVAGDEPQPSTARRWTELKKYLKSRGLTHKLQPELAAVAEYFKVRELAAHAATVVATVSESTQIFRLFYDGPTHRIDVASIEELRSEVATARAGHEAVQAIGRVMDDDRPEVLAGTSPLPKMMLIGRMH